MNDTSKVVLGAILFVFSAMFATLCMCITGAVVLTMVNSSPIASPAPCTAIESIYVDPMTIAPETSISLQPGDAAEVGGIEVEMQGHEYSGEYEVLGDYTDSLPEGSIYLWVEFKLRNTSDYPSYVPSYYDFALIIEGIQYESTPYYPGRMGYPAYFTGQLFPDATKIGWLQFTIPESKTDESMQLIHANFDNNEWKLFSWELAPDEG